MFAACSANMRIIKISTLVHGSVTHFHREWNAKIIKNEIRKLFKLNFAYISPSYPLSQSHPIHLFYFFILLPRPSATPSETEGEFISPLPHIPHSPLVPHLPLVPHSPLVPHLPLVPHSPLLPLLPPSPHSPIPR